ncbi:TIGR01777 family oxidoreductase [Staphylospora marina]|uniref:TIGR01777 family oxidoreductase n=1 Tax=Staphylospora marina TaxID=2490858 RepID=UPI0013DDE1B6|nr:TIGR01777 family oxidoreductase [Staphylospora marina]
MRIAITGSSGLVGTCLVNAFLKDGHDLLLLVRKPGAGDPRCRHSLWDPERGVIDRDALEGMDAVIHLAGKSINGRFTRKHKEQVLSSRVKGTTLLSDTLASLKRPPRVFLSASGIGLTHQYDLVSDESNSLGDGFLPTVIQPWEASTQPAIQAGIRTVLLRFGIVLSKDGGALKQMLPVYRMGLGGKIGHGKQVMSWISIEEIPHILRFLMERETVSGVVNMTAPRPVTNEEFVRTLGKVLERPVLFPVPAFAIHLLFGEMGEELLLKGNPVLPKKLLDEGYTFRHPELEPALRRILGRESG